MFVFQPPHDTAFRGVRLGVCSRRFRGLLAQQDVLLAESSSPEIVSTRRFVLRACPAGGGGGCRPRVGVRHERPCRGFVPERIGLFGHPSICNLVGSGQCRPDGVGDPLPGGGRDVDVQPAGPLGRFFVQREGCLGACHALMIASHVASDSPRRGGRGPPGWLGSGRVRAWNIDERPGSGAFWHPGGSSATVSRLAVLLSSPARPVGGGTGGAAASTRTGCGFGLLDN